MSATFADYWAQRYAGGGHFITRHFSQYLGAVGAYTAQRAGLTPSQVTLLGAAVFLGGAWAFVALPNSLAAAALCAVVFQLGYGLDCADGQLARATARTSEFGAWLDLACDYVRHVVLAAAVALWVGRHHAPGLALAAALLFAAGSAVHLHTVSALRRGAAEAATPRGRLRELLMAVFDAATVLLVLALLRPWPTLLGLAAAAYGALFFGVSVLLARKRLR